MKLIEGMGGYPHRVYQEPGEPLGLSWTGRSVPVSSMPLKGTGEVRGKPLRGPAWLRGRRVSPNECATKRNDAMEGNSHSLYQGGDELLGLSAQRKHSEGERAAPERYPCGPRQATKRRGLAQE